MALVFFQGCDRQAEERRPAPAPAPEKAIVREQRCQGCHPEVLDRNHDLDCTLCHGGKQPAPDKEAAHHGLLSRPAAPDRMVQTCGPCHQEQVRRVLSSSHFTMKNLVNSVRQLFGAKESLHSLLEIPEHERVDSSLALADDLLRRRCLRCHPYYQGDAYDKTRRGLGCAACHLEYEAAGLSSHQFVGRPGDGLCLKCHYGNRVGSDYYGRFEHDFSVEYRSPFQKDGDYPPRPYGVESHQLSTDIHQRAGLSCLDCHSGKEIMGMPDAANDRLSCRSCHQQGKKRPVRQNLFLENEQLFLRLASSGKKLEVPALSNPAHLQADRVDCVVCHAQWSYNDRGRHLMRHDVTDFEPWWALAVQGSSEVEQQVWGAGANPPYMQDKISGETRPGIWYMGYELRRWEAPLIRRDSEGRLRLFRPILDLSLSYVDQEERLIFDSVTPQDPLQGLRPYTPHTIGKAGIFYGQRLEEQRPQ